MTREELVHAACVAVPSAQAAEAILAHDAEQREEIERAREKLSPMACGHAHYNLTKGNLRRTDEGDCVTCLLHEEIAREEAELERLTARIAKAAKVLSEWGHDGDADNEEHEDEGGPCRAANILRDLAPPEAKP